MSKNTFSTLLLGGLILSPWLCAGVAVIEDPPAVQRLSHITTAVTGPSSGVYRYEYTVHNDSVQQFFADPLREVWPLIIGYEVPLDNPGVLSNIESPETWSYRFLDNAAYVNLYGMNPFQSLWVLQWYDRDLLEPNPQKTIAPAGYNERFGGNEYQPFASGFGFDATLAPTDGPYANLWMDELRNIGDPPLPGGSLGGGGLPYTRVVPDGGSTLAFMLFAFAALGALQRTSKP